MNCSFRSARRFVTATLATSAIFTFGHAQVLNDPYVVEMNGAYVGLTWNLTGGQVGITGFNAAGAVIGYEPFESSYNLYGNDAIFKWVQAALNNQYVPLNFTYASALQGPTNVWRATAAYPKSVEFPGCDATVVQTGVMRVKQAMAKAEAEAEATRITKPGVDKLTSQRQFSSCNFKLEIAGLPCARTLRVKPSPITFTPTISGGKVSAITAEFQPSVFEVPPQDAQPFIDAANATLAGTGKIYNGRLDYLDGNGNVIMSLVFDVQILGCDHSNLFETRAADPYKVKYLTGHVTLIK